MASLNKVMLIGNVTRDPVLKYTPKAKAVTEVSLAINRTWKDDEGVSREEVTFVDVTYWGRSAEILTEYVRKGAPLYIEGRLRLDSWEDRNTGQKRNALRVSGEGFQFLGKKQNGGVQVSTPEE